MIIGINAAAAIKQPRTGVEEYTYQLIKHLTMLPEAKEHRFLLYLPKIESSPPQLRKGLRGGVVSEKNHHPTLALPSSEGRGHDFFDFPLPPNFEVKILRWPLPFLWTQVRLAWEMWQRKPESLFIPAHILPIGAPANSVVAIHGLEYEYFSEYYSLWRKLYLRGSTARALKRARRLIAVSANTKDDLAKLYGVEAEKISVVYHGINIYNPSQPPLSLRGGEILHSPPFAKEGAPPLELRGGGGELWKPYILYLGRLETKKNVQGILEAYKILKEQYGVPHKLVLAGAPGYGYKTLRRALLASSSTSRSGRACSGNNIVELGYVLEDEKWQLLANADVFLFPSFYEGFGLPILEAQVSGVPVVTSANSCFPEIAGQGALFVNPKNSAQIAEVVKQVIDDSDLRDRLRQSGFKNVKRFSWEKCAKKTLEVVVGK